ncbi:helix-turn-helix domain-containing protein [Catenulispora yoronensis]|uniref:Helix-turn-helix domain-containing protein n=1 Tax=Catenulispora yoronensis TaxID=450799 RepID=A0ABN2U8R8_9ACTN
MLNPPQSTFEVGFAAELFAADRPGEPSPYSFDVCAVVPGPLRTQAGYSIAVTRGLEALEDADTVLIPGWQPAGEPVPPPVLAAVVAAHARGARIAGICSGAFVPVEAGLLDGRRATTHWMRTAELAARFPEVEVDADVLYVDHGDVATSAGLGAGIDLCLHLIRGDHGAAYASRVAKFTVLPPHREGGQLQYAYTAPVAASATASASASAPRAVSLAPLLEWARSHLDAPLTLDRLAARAGVSSRTLARQFEEQLGQSPGRWLLQQRIAEARVLLEETSMPIEAIAVRVGLHSIVNMRRRFQALVGTTPGAYRRTFRQSEVQYSRAAEIP